MSNPRGGVGRDGGESHIELTIVAAGTSSKEGAEDDDTDADVDDDTAPLVSRDANKHETSTSKPAAPEETHATPASAVAMYAGGVLASSLTALGARLLHDRGVAIHYVVLGRAILGMMAVMAGLLWYKGGVANPLGERRAALCLRGAIGMSAIYAFFVTSAYLPLADAAVTTFISPLVTAAGASLILREKPHWAIWCAIPVCAFGGVLVVQPTCVFGATRSRHLSGVGVAAAGATAVLGGTSKIIIRALSGGLHSGGGSRGVDGERIKKEHPLTIMWYTNAFCIGGMSILALATIGNGGPTVIEGANVAEIAALWILSSVTGFTAQMCITTALGRAPASAVAPVQYLAVVFAATWGLLCLGEVPGSLEVMGILIVSLGSAGASVTR
jgi:drug/metabolite transporter (DMT)-like permease